MAAVECEHLFVKAMSGCGCGQKFEIYAVSKTFNKVPILQRHRKVQEILKGRKFILLPCCPLPYCVLLSLYCFSLFGLSFSHGNNSKSYLLTFFSFVRAQIS